MASPQLHPSTITAVRERADIVDVVSEHVVLKRRGREFVGLCPFHEDKSPSMTVVPAKQLYYCFSCGAGGNSVKFLMELQQTSFAEVVLQLAQRYQVPVQTLSRGQQDRLRQQLSHQESLHRVLALAAGWFQTNLQQAGGQEALAYLQQRGLDGATIEKFQLGYAPDRWDALLRHLGQVEGVTALQLEAAGLAIPHRGGEGHYDRFRQRLMIPIRDKQGRVVGFGGRSLDGREPKYLNSPETAVFEKGKILFGLDMAAGPVHKADLAVVVEGYFDVIALHGAGVRNSVAALGTALSSWQIKQLCRASTGKRIVLNFDGDSAGARATQRAIQEVEQLALQGQLELRVFPLPHGQDPDDYLRQHGSDVYGQHLAAAPLWLDWQIEEELRDCDLSRADHFQRARRSMVELLGKLPPTAVRSRYMHQLAERLAGGQARLALDLEEDLRQQVRGQRWHGRSSRHAPPGEVSAHATAEGRILQLYLLCPDHRLAIRRILRQRDLEDFAIAIHRRLWAAITAVEHDHLAPMAGQWSPVDSDPAACWDHAAQSLTSLDLPPLLMAYLSAEDAVDLQPQLTALLHPSEAVQVELGQPLPTLKAAAAKLARHRSERRGRHLLEAWSAQPIVTTEHCIATLLEQEATASPGTDPDSRTTAEDKIHALHVRGNKDALHLQELYYVERRNLSALDKERCGALEDQKPLRRDKERQ
ncbi:DNA primase [Candidatus Synechococcus spongiarum]|uniref:DNA primase n=1 Tax=Candidatus Synechococcus spongiarum TaxID=431041 RepID=A0A165AFD3_9SYNE|nr:DNA primase [Candidatus Synechococcus spongiarum]SAY38687.1 DNA primase (EC 2.7.7.-) [Candidatus Synechococcus spongiarum]